ncbi:MAG TPA: FGGY-family carbohydrate kinase [Bauldia sp.]|nr:FGGY-family carbohydrate kinase [Bauldia sp.]
MGSTLLAIDVGTLSARAGVFDPNGAPLGSASAAFELLKPLEHHAVYRMDDIWAAVGEAVREAVSLSRRDPREIAGIAFDATSSLAVSATGPRPLDGDADVFCWMDHRGEAEAAEIDETGDRYLDYVGGSVSPEVNLPKLLWLKRRRPEAWARLTGARDLVDELARRATGVDGHSLCGFSCKWPYLPGRGGWRQDLLNRLGIGELPRLGSLSRPPLPVGSVHGRLSTETAEAWRLPPGVPVAVGLIDAEAGTLGVIGKGYAGRINRTLSMISGTSNSYIAFAVEERRITGVWGPNRDAVFPGYWMHEAGQTLAGAALDSVLTHHPAGPRVASAENHIAIAREIIDLLDREGPHLAARRHIVPDWLGNRSPLGDGRTRALVVGLGEETSRRAFLEAYYATARALALQTRHIIEHLNANGYEIDRVAIAGGQLKNPLLVRLYRDALGADLVLSDHPETVLLGTSMVASVAAGWSPDLFAAIDRMAPVQSVVPADASWRTRHDHAYRIYLKLFHLRNEVEAESRMIHAAVADEPAVHTG